MLQGQLHEVPLPFLFQDIRDSNDSLQDLEESESVPAGDLEDRGYVGDGF